MSIFQNKGRLLAIAVLAMAANAAFIQPARADDDRRGRGHEHDEWREHEWRARHWHRRYVQVYPEQVPAYVYAPPPVVYAPPPPPPGINLIIPLNIR
jgi:hypothetical protein